MSLTNNSTKQIKVTLSLEDYEKLKRLAIDKEISMAEYVRKQLNINFSSKRQRNLNIEHKQLIFHLIKIGANINQIAKAFNICVTAYKKQTANSNKINKIFYSDLHAIKMYLYKLSEVLS
jgi:transcription initiation factor TFIIIB Brf1 subunit/transcription initiation factor TFIIB